jgi:hypothetical protein
LCPCINDSDDSLAWSSQPRDPYLWIHLGVLVVVAKKTEEQTSMMKVVSHRLQAHTTPVSPDLSGVKVVAVTAAEEVAHENAQRHRQLSCHVG